MSARASAARPSAMPTASFPKASGNVPRRTEENPISELADLPAGAGHGRQCPQGRARHDRLLCRPLHSPKRAGTCREGRRRTRSQNWLTFRQALDIGGNVRKGERGTTVCYADRFIPQSERERAEKDGEEPDLRIG